MMDPPFLSYNDGKPAKTIKIELITIVLGLEYAIFCDICGSQLVTFRVNVTYLLLINGIRKLCEKGIILPFVACWDVCNRADD